MCSISSHLVHSILQQGSYIIVLIPLFILVSHTNNFGLNAGGTRSASYESLLQQHNRVPADALQQLLQQCLARVQASDHAGSEGLQSLLAAGPLASLPSLAAAHKPQIPQWMRHPATHAALPQLQLLQQTGLARASNSNSSRRLPLQYTADQFCHHATFRGHGFPVFSLIFDKDGRRIVTGADDAIIKVRLSAASTAHANCLCTSAQWHWQRCVSSHQDRW
eukprot:GHUV01049758.1.p1 GENE.GHUV01049758.1~~GHUV01049758.1.p1  ORF type:complete len:221 (+),score=51.25 GHUV01049758.1:483-1145(+)